MPSTMVCASHTSRLMSGDVTSARWRAEAYLDDRIEIGDPVEFARDVIRLDDENKMLREALAQAGQHEAIAKIDASIREARG